MRRLPAAQPVVWVMHKTWLVPAPPSVQMPMGNNMPMGTLKELLQGCCGHAGAGRYADLCQEAGEGQQRPAQDTPLAVMRQQCEEAAR